MSSFIGQFHPLLVHLPIGILLVGLYFKIVSVYSPRKYQEAIPHVVLLAWISAIASVVTGYLLSLNGSYEEDLLNNHKWLGIALMLVTGLLYLFIDKKSNKAYQNIAWSVSGILLFITGHLGGSLTHGEGYLSFGTPSYQKPVLDTIELANVYTDIIEPIFAQKCWSCHSSGKQKGGLRLDDFKYVLRGGKHGAILSDQEEKSKLYHRITLAEEDDDHMPPAGKPQPTASEIKLITWWLSNGSPIDKQVHELQAAPEIHTILDELVHDQTPDIPPHIPTVPASKADPAAISALNAQGIHVLPVAQNSNYLQVNFNRKNINSTQWNLLNKISKNIVWLNASYLKLSDTAIHTISSLEHLTKLDLSHSKFQDKNLQFLSSLQHLQSLNLSYSDFVAQNLKDIGTLDQLEQLYLFQTKVDPSIAKDLSMNFPKAHIDTGHYIVPTYRGDTSELTYEEFYKTKKAKLDSLERLK